MRSVQQFAGLVGTSARLASKRLSVSVSFNARLDVDIIIPMPDDRGGSVLWQWAEAPMEVTREAMFLAVGPLGSGRRNAQRRAVY